MMISENFEKTIILSRKKLQVYSNKICNELTSVKFASVNFGGKKWLDILNN